MKNLSVKNGIASFDALDKFGIKNGFSYSSQIWGNMSLKVTDVEVDERIAKLHKFSRQIGVTHKNFAFMNVEHADTICHLTELSWELRSVMSDNYGIILIHGDGIITKLNIPIIVTPADCAVLIVAGIDENDSQKFILVAHAGLSSTILGIHKKIIENAHKIYKFDNSDLIVCISPFIYGKNYVKNKRKHKFAKYFTNAEWKKYVVQNGDNVEVHFGRKIISDLNAMGISQIYESGLDTYSEHLKSNLFSNTLSKQSKVEDRHKSFLIECSL